MIGERKDVNLSRNGNGTGEWRWDKVCHHEDDACLVFHDIARTMETLARAIRPEADRMWAEEKKRRRRDVH